jgi:hypothetical protein
MRMENEANRTKIPSSGAELKETVPQIDLTLSQDHPTG